MKKLLLYIILGILAFLLTGAIALVLVLFFWPSSVLNPRMLDVALKKTEVLKEWSWSEAEINHEWIKWNERELSGRFKDFCFTYDHEAALIKSCLEEVSWDFKLSFNTKEGLSVLAQEPFKIRSKKTSITLKETDKKEEEPSSLPDIWRYWQFLWSKKTPDMDIIFKSIALHMKDKVRELDFRLSKSPKKLEIEVMRFKLIANPSSFKLIGPKLYELPTEMPNQDKVFLSNFKLAGEVSSNGISLDMTGAIEAIEFHITSYLNLPIRNTFDSVAFRKKLLLSTKGSLALLGLKESLTHYAPKPFTTLPAPLNVMNGDLKVDLKFGPLEDSEKVLLQSFLSIDLSSEKQVLLMSLTGDVPLSLKTFSPGSIFLGINFKKVTLQLPRLAKTSLPPQFFPDGRIITPDAKDKAQKEEKKTPENESLDLDLKLEALGENALHIDSNLLDEALRLNFDLNIKKGELKNGFLNVLPLETTLFKRPIHLKELKIIFNYPIDPVMEGRIVFPLPEYKITLNFEGPVSNPRHSFTSEPPLPQSDIYSVLLFGRPMADLNPDDKAAAGRTNQLLSQGILSLSVLYFLAGSPVEYIGYDPETRGATAQIGLGSKSSLRVGTGAGGSTSTSVRRSLGKGWYLDTSVLNNTGTESSRNQNYGVLLERIISY